LKKDIKVYLRCSELPLLLCVPGETCISIGESTNEIDCDDLVSWVDLNALADFLKVQKGSMEIITPEEYNSEFEEA
jgi:hypothetical protein